MRVFVGKNLQSDDFIGIFPRINVSFQFVASNTHLFKVYVLLVIYFEIFSFPFNFCTFLFENQSIKFQKCVHLHPFSSCFVWIPHVWVPQICVKLYFFSFSLPILPLLFPLLFLFPLKCGDFSFSFSSTPCQFTFDPLILSWNLSSLSTFLPSFCSFFPPTPHLDIS